MRALIRSARGQALVEFSIFFLTLGILMIGVLAFTQWMQTRQKLLLACKEGALLYSSGRVKAPEAEHCVRDFLATGAPPIDTSGIEISIGREGGVAGTYYQLDRVVVRYRPPSGWNRLLNFNEPMEEICIVRHAPSYGVPYQHLYGPPVGW